MDNPGKIFIVLGLVIIVIGIALSMGFKGLPGDIAIKRENVSFNFPIVSSILLSIILSVIVYLVSRR